MCVPVSSGTIPDVNRNANQSGPEPRHGYGRRTADVPRLWGRRHGGRASCASVALAMLYTALEPKITRFVRRYRGWERASWDADDVRQEAYLALCATVVQGTDAPSVSR